MPSLNVVRKCWCPVCGTVYRCRLIEASALMTTHLGLPLVYRACTYWIIRHQRAVYALMRDLPDRIPEDSDAAQR